jgi:glycosyltransferase involved in cell wall biosynthesis
MVNNIKKVKRIGIDARFYGPVGKGLGRYTKEVVDRIIALDHNSEYVIFLGKDNFEEFKTSNLKVKKVLADVRWYTLAEQILMPFYIWREKLDLMHWPHFNVPLLCLTKFIVTIHDLILTRFSTQRATTLSPFFYWLKNAAYKIIIRTAIKRAQKIIAVSEFTKNDIVQKFKVNRDKIVVTYEGVFEPLPRAGNEDDKKVLFRYNITSPFLLYVGNAYPHKNLEGLIKVFFKIRNRYYVEKAANTNLNKKKNNLQLVLVGKEDYFYTKVIKFSKEFDKRGNKIIFSGFVPDDDLVVFYRKALAYIFPSLYEGFGLPPLEAMAQGCPVVSSNKASMPEVLGEAAFYFNPEDKSEMYNQIIRIINNSSLREELIKKGHEQIKKYSWQECAEQTLAIYNSIF